MSTKRVKYVGPFDDDPKTGVAVHVAFPDGFTINAAKGEPIELADDYAEKLLEQEDNWQPVRSKSRSKDGDA